MTTRHVLTLPARPLRRGVVRASPARVFLAVLAALPVALSACGGGGGGGGGNTPAVLPPASLTYATMAPTYEADVAIAPNIPTVTGGVVELYSVAPALPTGLALDPATGILSGTPLATAALANYTVTASNDGGSAQAVLALSVDVNRSENLAAKTTFTDDDIRYFLGRTHFGGKASDFDTVKAMGIPAYVDQMVEYGATPSLDAEAFKYLLNTSDPVGLEGKFPNQQQVARYWVYLMTANPNPFQEVMAFFWHDHFASSTAPLEGSSVRWMVDQVQLWRMQGNGNLRSLLLSMSRDWIMLAWLDGVLNTKFSPNENFTREFWELFALGVDNGYTQADIVLAAKAFTGYRTRFDAVTNLEYVEFDKNRHDAGAKTILGVAVPAQNLTDDFKAVVDITVDTRPVAEFISKKLFEHFCYEAPSQVPTDAMAKMLRDNTYELKPLLKTLFKSEAFFSARSQAGLVKGPVEHLVGFVRSTGLLPIDPKSASDPAGAPPNMLRTFEGGLGNTAQRPTQPPSVNGWPVGEQWLSAQNMLDRGNVVLSCIGDRNDQTAAGVDVTTILPPVAQRTAPNVVDTLAALLNVKITPSERTTYITYLDTAMQSGVVVPSPFDGSNPAHISERVRGLLYILAQHPTYAIR